MLLMQSQMRLRRFLCSFATVVDLPSYWAGDMIFYSMFVFSSKGIKNKRLQRSVSKCGLVNIGLSVFAQVTSTNDGQTSFWHVSAIMEPLRPWICASDASSRYTLGQFLALSWTQCLGFVWALWLRQEFNLIAIT